MPFFLTGSLSGTRKTLREYKKQTACLLRLERYTKTMSKIQGQRAADGAPTAYLIEGIGTLNTHDAEQLQTLLSVIGGLGDVSIHALNSKDVAKLHQEAEPEPCYIMFGQFAEGDTDIFDMKSRPPLWNALYKYYVNATEPGRWSAVGVAPGDAQELFHLPANLSAGRSALLNLTALETKIRGVFAEYTRSGYLLDSFPPRTGEAGLRYLLYLIEEHLRPETPLQMPPLFAHRQTAAERTPGVLRRPGPKPRFEAQFLDSLTLDGHPTLLVTPQSFTRFARSRSSRRLPQLSPEALFAEVDKWITQQEGRPPTADPSTLAIQPALFVQAVTALIETNTGVTEATFPTMSCAAGYAKRIEDYLGSLAE